MKTSQTIAAAPTPEEAYQEPLDVDSWYSALVSFVFHFCLMLLLPLFAAFLEPEQRLPPAVGTVQVLDDSGTDADPAAGLPGAEAAAESLTQSESPDLMQDIPAAEAITEVQPVEVPQLDLNVPDAKQALESLRNDSAQAVAAAQAAARGARERLNQNLGGAPGGGGGGGGGTGRAGRAARWVLKFNYSHADHYLNQLGGLGAAIAFPQRGDQWLYFTDLAGRPNRSVRDLSGEDRIFWINEDPSSTGLVAQALGIAPLTPMLAFLPVELEQRMLKMELAYKGAASEQDIKQTVFECVARGGGFDVIVVDQKP